MDDCVIIASLTIIIILTLVNTIITMVKMYRLSHEMAVTEDSINITEVFLRNIYTDLAEDN